MKKDNFVFKLFTNDKVILLFILLNTAMIYLQESNITATWITVLDVVCTCVFVLEMVCKHMVLGVKQYWSSGWNRLDGTLVILSLPSLLAIVFPIEMMSFSFLLALRVLRVFRFFRIFHFFPHFTQIAVGFVRAIRQSYAVFVGLVIIILLFALISCAIYKDVAPEFFATPTDAIYSVFRLFTIEGWYEIPDVIAEAVSPAFARFTRIYFSLLLVLGGIIGVSLVNSIFVDAMVSDNNDELDKKIESLEKKIDLLLVADKVDTPSVEKGDSEWQETIKTDQ